MTQTSAPLESAVAERPPEIEPLRRVRVGALGERFGLLIAWAVVVAVFGPLRPDSFLQWSTFAGIFGSQAMLVVLTLALLITLTAGDFDVSVAFVAGLAANMIAVLNVEHHWPIGWAIAAALAAGAVVGVVNGLIVVQLGIDSLIATLGTGTIVGGVVLWISNLNTISGISRDLVQWVVVNRLFGISLEFYYALALCVILWYVFHWSRVGQHLLVVGRSPEVARLVGLPTRKLRWWAYVWSGLIAASGGVLYAGTIGASDPVSFRDFLFPSFAAVFLGATAIYPGRFNPWGSFIAVYFLVTGITALQIMGIQSFVHDVFYGGALVVAVIFSQFLRRRQTLEAPRRHLPPGALE